MDDGDETRDDRTVDERPRTRDSRPSKPLIAARYRMGKEIGHGGMGDVIAAHDDQIGREVAIKRIRTDAPSERMIKRFMREARIQGRLEHPAIVPVHELGRDTDGMPFFAMKKLVGNPLSKILDNPDRDRVKYGRQRLLRALADVSLAIEFAHVAGIIHRDIKPDNIVLGDFGEVYVLDWGVAKVLGETDELEDLKTDGLQTNVGAAIGTRGYMSPEQAMGEADIDARSDIYALGIVLGDILDADPEPPPELTALRERATAEKRADRVQTARELAESVQRFLDGDRDLAMRRKLALEHLEVAKAAMPEREGFEARRKAMMQAGRALALDPELAEAGQLITQLIVEPPTDVPPEVRAELRSTEADHVRALARVSLFGAIGYITALPGLIGMGSIAYAIAFTACIACTTAINAYTARTAEPPRTVVWGIIAMHVPIFFVLSRMYSPVTLAFGVALIVAAAVAANPYLRGRRDTAIAFAMLAGGMVVPFAAERLGWVSPTLRATPEGDILLQGTGLHATSFIVNVLVPCFVVITLLVCMVVGHSTRTAAQRLRERFHVQAWQIRHLMPEQRRR